MIIRLPALLAGLLLLGCGGTPIARTTDNRIQKPAISIGMSLTDALQLLRENGVLYEEVATAIASDNAGEQLREFLVRPSYKSADAAEVIAAASVGSDDYAIRQITWHLNWEDDSAYPLTLRINRVLYLDELELAVLEEIPDEVLSKRASFQRDNEKHFDF